MSPKASALLRQLGIGSATALVIGSIGRGILTTSGFLAGQLGSAKLVLLMGRWRGVRAGGCVCYSELGVNFPSSGGEYVYLTEAFGPTWGFMTGWISFFAGFSAPIAAAALAFSDYLGHFSTSLRLDSAQHVIGSGSWELKLGAAQVLASAIIVLFTIINCLRGFTARVPVLTSLKIVIILTFLVMGFAFGQGDWQNFTHPAVRTSVTPIFAQFFVSLFYIYVAYSGWNAATYVAEELKRPARFRYRWLTGRRWLRRFSSG